jgi:hypothetical protein
MAFEKATLLSFFLYLRIEMMIAARKMHDINTAAATNENAGILTAWLMNWQAIRRRNAMKKRYLNTTSKLLEISSEKPRRKLFSFLMICLTF